MSEPPAKLTVEVLPRCWVEIAGKMRRPGDRVTLLQEQAEKIAQRGSVRIV